MIDGIVTGDAEVVRRFAEMGPRLKAELRDGIGRLVIKLQRNVQQQKLSGQVLKVRTGRLRRSIGQLVLDEGAKVVGVVSTPVEYARAHEYGFKGTVNVREHMRVVKQAFGKPISPREVSIRAHSVQVNLPERSFLRSALRDLEASGAIATEIDAAVAKAVA